MDCRLRRWREETFANSPRDESVRYATGRIRPIGEQADFPMIPFLTRKLEPLLKWESCGLHCGPTTNKRRARSTKHGAEIHPTGRNRNRRLRFRHRFARVIKGSFVQPAQ